MSFPFPLPPRGLLSPPHRPPTAHTPRSSRVTLTAGPAPGRPPLQSAPSAPPSLHALPVRKGRRAGRDVAGREGRDWLGRGPRRGQWCPGGGGPAGRDAVGTGLGRPQAGGAGRARRGACERRAQAGAAERASSGRPGGADMRLAVEPRPPSAARGQPGREAVRARPAGRVRPPPPGLFPRHVGAPGGGRDPAPSAPGRTGWRVGSLRRKVETPGPA